MELEAKLKAKELYIEDISGKLNGAIEELKR